VGGHLLRCRSSTMNNIASVAPPCICPPGARARMGSYSCANPKCAANQKKDRLSLNGVQLDPIQLPRNRLRRVARIR
jgi:hypothetical protein